MRMIDGDALRDNLQALAYDDWNQGVTTSWADAYREVADMVEEMPTVEERKTGKWIRGDAEKLTGSQRCSICHKACYKGKDYFNFCPNCGSYNGGDSDG